MAAGGTLLVILVLTSVNVMLAKRPNSPNHRKTLNILLKQSEFLRSFQVVHYWYGISIHEEHYIVTIECSWKFVKSRLKHGLYIFLDLESAFLSLFFKSNSPQERIGSYQFQTYFITWFSHNKYSEQWEMTIIYFNFHVILPKYSPSLARWTF